MSVDKSLISLPLLFQDDRITRFYIGGKLMNQWRRMEGAEDSHQCEELLVTSIGAIVKGEPEGYAVSRTIEPQGGVLLSQLLREYPNEILGKEFQDYNPGQLSVLARAGDTTVRLVMQCHPRREDAKKYFGMPMGKTEAWYIAETREVPGEETCVYAGFRQHVTKELWWDLFKRQDTKAMLDCLHKIPVSKGQTILIPAGMPHCMGPGCLFVEFHECNDVTVRVEKAINGMVISEEEMFNGLKAEAGMNLFDYRTYSEEEIRNRVVMQKRAYQSDGQYELAHAIGPEQNDSFGIDLLTLHGTCDLPEKPYHRVLVAVRGDAVLQSGGKEYRLVQGHGALVPASCKDLKFTGEDCEIAIGIPFINGKISE